MPANDPLAIHFPIERLRFDPDPFGLTSPLRSPEAFIAMAAGDPLDWSHYSEGAKLDQEPVDLNAGGTAATVSRDSPELMIDTFDEDAWPLPAAPLTPTGDWDPFEAPPWAIWLADVATKLCDFVVFLFSRQFLRPRRRCGGSRQCPSAKEV
jgi:hypothetical protein